MARATDPSKRVQWMWNASANPFSESQTPEWTLYTDMESIIIEKAFQEGRTHALLDNYSIDFKQNMQILNSDSNRQRPVMRRECNSNEIPIRTHRFTIAPITPQNPVGGLYGWISPFIRAAAKHLNITRKQLPSKDKSVVPMIVEKAAAGIIEEGKKIGQKRKAEGFAEMLLEEKDKGVEAVWKRCAYLYSLEDFLYQKVNEMMRLIGSKEYEHVWRDAARTLGPFCLLLWDNPMSDKAIPVGTILYRGADLTPDQIAFYEKDAQSAERPVRSFQSFVSCSRNRAAAVKFGETLFIMNVKHAFATDLKLYSAYPLEDEELISPGACFTVERVYFDNVIGKRVIDLHLFQQYRRKSTHLYLFKFSI